ncbi:cupin domain-containing protein, partial [Streptomyces violaceoruber]
GDLAVLREGDRTTWTVHETLRKAYAIDLGRP